MRLYWRALRFEIALADMRLVCVWEVAGAVMENWGISRPSVRGMSVYTILSGEHISINKYGKFIIFSLLK